MTGVLGALVGAIGPFVPRAPAAPTVTLQVNQDTVSWLAPHDGGSPITLYYWESTDSKSGTTANTSVAVPQEGSTSQAYRVRAQNSVGLGEWSLYSFQVTTTPPFFPGFGPSFPSFPSFPYFSPGSPCSGPSPGVPGYCVCSGGVWIC
jgi:hypothetical protein